MRIYYAEIRMTQQKEAGADGLSERKVGQIGGLTTLRRLLERQATSVQKRSIGGGKNILAIGENVWTDAKPKALEDM